MQVAIVVPYIAIVVPIASYIHFITVKMINRMILLFFTLLFSTNYISCSTSVRSECINETAEWSNDDLEDMPISVLTNTGYCFVNECTIRIKESNVLLNIINRTADWIAATNSTNLFTILFPSNNIIYCSQEEDTIQDNSNTNHFIFFAVIGFIIISSSSVNIVLHLAVKELRSTPGFIIIGICATIIIMYLATVITAVFQYLHRVNDNTAICAVFKYIITYFLLMYTMLKATYLFHFAYIMYLTYTSRPYQEKNRRLLYTYSLINIVATVVCSVVLTIIDMLEVGSGVATNDGFCTRHFISEPGSSDYQILVPLLATTTGIGIIFFIVALTLYYLTTKRFCTCGDVTGPNDIRISLSLISVTSLGTLVLIILLLAGIGGDGSVMISSISICVEQIVLLAVFLTSRKARDKLWRYFERKVSREAETESS